jgi:hypothetical protein
MTPQQIVGLGVRLFAIWLALSGVNYITTIFRFMALGLSGLFVQIDETDVPQNVEEQKNFPKQSCHEEQQK